MVVADVNGCLLHCNEAFTQQFGYTVEDIKGQHQQMLFTEEDRQKQMAELEVEQATTQGRAHHSNYLVHKNGQPVWVEGELTLARDGDGCIYLLKLIQKQQDQKAAEASIQELQAFSEQVRSGEQRMRNLIEQAPVATAVYVGKEMVIQYANDAMLRMMGKGRQVIGLSFFEALPELNNQSYFDLLRQVYETGRTYWAPESPAEVMVDGKVYASYYNFSYKALRNENGEVYGILNMAIDVGEQVRIKRRIQESERMLSTIINEAPVGICTISKEHNRIELVNDVFLELVSRSREEMIGHDYWEVLPEVAEIYEPILAEVFATGIHFQGVEHAVPLMVEGKKEIVYISFVYEPISNEQGVVEKVLIVALNVSLQVLARQQIEQLVEKRTGELAEANRNLQRSNAELAQFAYVASHDLQEPLRKIQLFGNYLQTRALGRLEETERNYLHKIIDSSQRMRELIRSVLEYSMLDGKKHEAEFTEVDLNQVWQAAQKDLEVEIAEKEASIESDPLPILPAIEVQMHQLWYNLLSNSLKFAARNRQPKISLRLGTLKEADKKSLGLKKELTYHCLELRDNGIGFDPQLAPKLFDMFQRLHTRSEYQGTGIGLTTCKKVVENHGGRIYADGKPDQGACFRVILPAGR